MEVLLAETYVNENLLKTLAWVFTLISGVASIALTISKFGLSKGKQITLIAGTLGFGLAVVFFVIPQLSKSSAPDVITMDETKDLQLLAGVMGDFSGGYKRTANGIVSEPARGSVNRVSEHVYAVMHPNGDFDAIYSGDFFEATVDGKQINCELIDLGSGRILIVKGEETEFVELDSDQSKNTFKIKKVSVQAQTPPTTA